MVIDLRKCAEQPLELRQSFDLSARFASYAEIETIDEVKVQLQVAPVGAGRFLLRGSLSTKLRACCVRCLEPFDIGLERSFALTCLRADTRPQMETAEREMDLSEVDICYYEEDRLDLVALLGEQVDLALPMRLLCADGCLGLCQYCGANKNLTDCGCVGPPRLDPRLESLKGLRH